MSTEIKDFIIQVFAGSGGTDIKLLDPDSDFLNRYKDQDHLIEIILKGGATGVFLLLIDEELARIISARVLTRAVESDFAPDDIDKELAANTIGELINIALGEFFTGRTNPSPVDISSPNYLTVETGKDKTNSLSSQMTFETEGQVFDIKYELNL